MANPTPNKRRSLRRLRAELRRELGTGAVPTRAEKTLIELAALTALRTRELREEFIAGKEPSDEDFVRLVRATTAITKAFRDYAGAKSRAAAPKTFEERMRARKQRTDDGHADI
jgi:hypothetical protein